MSVSVLILTLDEEVNLQRCLESVSWSDDIIVFDSYSTDRTVEIARDFGARVVQRRFDNWASHQNWANHNIDFKHPWIYYSDADEQVSSNLAEEIGKVTQDTNRPEVAYSVRFRNIFMDKWLKHASLYPTWVLRLFRPEKIRWERLVNPIAVVDGITGKLENHFDHFIFSKGFESWFAKHNKYSWFEAQETIKELQYGRIDWKTIFGRDPRLRRSALKNLSFHLPLRPLAKFLFMYFARLGFLDGSPGLTYCLLQAVYEAMIVTKVKEIRRAEKGLSM